MHLTLLNGRSSRGEAPSCQAYDKCQRKFLRADIELGCKTGDNSLSQMVAR